MFGRIWPETSRERVPGQVPKKFHIRKETPPTPEEKYFGPIGPIASYETLLEGLGFDDNQQREILSMLKSEISSAPNELGLRKNLMMNLLTRGFQSNVRRQVFYRALRYYRGIKKSLFHVSDPLEKAARGGKYYRRVTVDGKAKYFRTKADYDKYHDAHVSGKEAQSKYLRGAMRKLLDKAGPGGCPMESIGPFVRKYGHELVAQALRENGQLEVKNGKIVLIEKGRADRTPPFKFHILRKDDSEDSNADLERGAGRLPVPVGTQRQRGKEILQKLPDGTWKVVGNVTESGQIKFKQS